MLKPCAYFTSIWVHYFSAIHAFAIAYKFFWLCYTFWCLFKSCGMDESSYFVSHFFFGLSIAWVWAFSSLIRPMSPFTSNPWASWCSYHATALFLLWCCLPLFTVLPLSLRAEVFIMSVSYVIPSFSLQYPIFLLG